MSEPDDSKNDTVEDTPDDQEPEPRGTNLPLMYIVLILALLFAMAFAIFIVKPFYLRR